MWGGGQPDLPYLHNNEKKKSMSSVMEVCHLASGRWEQKPTTGTPPLGVYGYASAVIGREIFFLVDTATTLVVTIIVYFVLMLIPSNGRNSLLQVLTMVL